MSTLIIKSKIWNILPNKSINYKDKKFHKQKLSIDHSSIIYRQQNKIIEKRTEDGITNTSNDNTNYMMEKKDELISIAKTDENKYIINCGNWSKDLTKLINENAAYILYKGLTIENLLKEKQKYYVLNQGDILKLGKVYLKLLHINLSNDNQEEEDKKSEEDKNNDNNSIKEEVKEDDNEDQEEINIINVEEEEKKDDNEEENNKEKKEENEEILLTYTNKDLNLTQRIKNVQKKKRTDKNNNNIKNDKSKNYSFSYIPNNYKNINLYIKQITKEKNNYKLNSSFNGKIPLLSANNIIKESININRPKSPKLSKIKYFKLLKQLDSNDLINSKTYPKNNAKVATKLVKKSKFKLTSLKKKDESKKQYHESINKSDTIQFTGKICRICFIGEEDSINNPLLCPCICKGSMKYIHYLCLKNWLNLKVESELGHQRNISIDQPTITYSTNDISCELCKTKLPDYIKHKGKIFNVLFYKPKYDKFMVFESIRDDNNRTKFIHIIPLVKKNLIKIGRLNSCDLSLPDISISRVHCCIYIEGGQLFMENNSKYGTKILVQNNSLVMSSSFPLCLEIQNTYLKLILKKNFSFFGCCGVNTTTISKMLVYQEQNEKGFDIFCSMFIKEDDENEKEEQKDSNTNTDLNNNRENSNDNKLNEDIKNNENGEDNNSRINRNKKRKITDEFVVDKNSIKEISKENFKNHSINEQEFNNLLNNLNEFSKEEILNKKENNEEKEIKSIKIIQEDTDQKKYTYRTLDHGEYPNLMNESEIKSCSNIYNEMNRTIQKFNKNMNDKILTNLTKEKYRNKEIVNRIKKELAKENAEIINSDLENNKTKINNEVQKSINAIQNKKIELNINNIEEIQNNKIYKNKIEDQIRQELNIKDNNLIKDNGKDNKIKENINNDESKDESEKIKLSQKQLINKKLKNKNSQNNININLGETKSGKTLSYLREETTKNIINLNQKEEKNNIKISTENNKINKEIKMQKKFQKNIIDLKEINELSYCRMENSCNIKNSPIDNYQAIFGLSLKNSNKGSSMLAPKHKNINFLKLELNTDNENNFNPNQSNISKNRYTYQYEEDKKSKNNK